METRRAKSSDERGQIYSGKTEGIKESSICGRNRSKILANLVLRDKRAAAIKPLNKESSPRALSISPEMMEGLKLKHPPSLEIEEDSVLYGPVDFNPRNIFDQIDEIMIYNAAMITKGSAGPSGMDTQLYRRRILCSTNFHAEGKLLREEIATMTGNLQKTSYHPSLLESFTSCRLVPLDKNPGILPIGIGEVLRPIMVKPSLFC